MHPTQKIAQLIFSTMSHRFYDFIVYRFISPYIWQCDTESIVKRYRQNLSNNHMEVGVGTGFLIKRSKPACQQFSLTLMDFNKSCLFKSADYLHEYHPDLQLQNILEPFQQNRKHYDSIGMNYMLHCVPGNFVTKAVVFDHVYNALNHGGVFFGMTLLNKGSHRNTLSKMLMKCLNTFRIFTNQNDNLDDFVTALRQRFNNAEISIQGSAVIWKAIK